MPDQPIGDSCCHEIFTILRQNNNSHCIKDLIIFGLALSLVRSSSFHPAWVSDHRVRWTDEAPDL